MPRSVGLFVGIIVLVAVFALLRPDSEASGNPTVTTGASATKIQPNRLPPQLTDRPSGGGETAADDLVILDQPTESSKPQPGDGSDLTQTSNLSDLGSTAETLSDASQLDKAALTIRILNGGGKAGAAAALRDGLTKQSFTISSIGNAQQTYETTIIYYQTGQRVAAELLSKSLGEPAVTLEENAIATPADVLIVIGADRSAK